MQPTTTLGQRLRDLRENHWPGPALTQAQLARVLSTVRSVTPPVISSWENGTKLPPPERLEAYATFFCTRRSIEADHLRLLPELDLSESEHQERQRLHSELTALREDAIVRPAPPPPGPGPTQSLGTFWQFGDDLPINIVCAPLPDEVYRKMPFTDPQDPDYVTSYRYADIDALFELYGHLRAVNPTSKVRIRLADDLTADRLTEHLVLLGGVDWNNATREVLQRIDLPLHQYERDDDADPTKGGGFEVVGSDPPLRFDAVLAADPETPLGKILVGDVAQLFRTRNPFNQKRTVTICNGAFARGTFGAVRALTDIKFRNRNEDYLRRRFGNAETFSVLMRVDIVGSVALTPDWTNPSTCLHEWSVPVR